jgi:NAD(P)-dependent dehydrogenase (short-subunit alcohol dehydrogenase family)
MKQHRGRAGKGVGQVLWGRLQGCVGEGRSVHTTPTCPRPAFTRTHGQQGYSNHAAYSLSKLLMAMYSAELAARLGGEDLPVVSCDPGTVSTKMLVAGACVRACVVCAITSASGVVCVWLGLWCTSFHGALCPIC